MSKLNEFINRLENEKNFSLTFKDNLTNKNIVANYSNDEFLVKYGSVDFFLNKLSVDGYSDVKVIPRMKRGNAYQPIDEPINLKIEQKGIKAQPIQPTPQTDFNYHPEPPIHNAQVMPSFGLMGAGLNAPETIYKAFDHNRLVQENQSLQNDNKGLVAENLRLKEELLEKKFSREGSAQTTNLISEVIKAAPMLVGAFKGAAAPQGLTGPDTNLSEIKNNLISLIKQVPDDVNDYLLKTIMLLQTQPNFSDEFYNLFEKYETN